VAKIVKRYTFEASHWLPKHEGKCAKLHGHSYKIELCAGGEINPLRGKSDDGMVADFSTLDEVIKPVIESLDHGCLNDWMDTPTAEHVGLWFFSALSKANFPYVVWIRVWETEKAYAEVYPEDFILFTQRKGTL
jgi:6-pyruvoyltetrahydropterin/6-carboxytetrahydropterin synthase